MLLTCERMSLRLQQRIRLPCVGLDRRRCCASLCQGAGQVDLCAVWGTEESATEGPPRATKNKDVKHIDKPDIVMDSSRGDETEVGFGGMHLTAVFSSGKRRRSLRRRKHFVLRQLLPGRLLSRQHRSRQWL